MGLRIVLADREPIGLALRRFNKLLYRHGVMGEQRRRKYFIKPTGARRAKRFQKKFKARQATLFAKMNGLQPVSSLSEAIETFWRRTGKR
jgi:small subunit ribosomal protein S21